MAIKNKPGVKLERLVIHPGAMKKIRTLPDLIEVQDRIAATIANEATRNAIESAGPGGYQAEAEFAVDGDVSEGRRGRYRASVRTHNKPAVIAEYHDDALTKAFDTVARKLGGDA